MLKEKDYCDYDTCVALKELGYNQSSIAFYPCQDIIVDCVDLNGDLYEAEYDKGNLVLYSSLNNKNHDINKVQAPLLYEAQKWLRKEKGIIVEPIFAYMDEKRDKYYSVQIVTDIRFDDENYTYECATMKFEESKGYEKALSEGIKEAVKILK